jgi:hypothetical protein
VLFRSCNLGPIELVITPKGARAIRGRAAQRAAITGVRAQAASFPVTLAGSDVAVLHVGGQGGAPQVALVDPSGQRVEPVVPPTPEAAQAAPVTALPDAESAQTIVTIKNPRRGRWQVVQAGGAPVTSIDRTEQQAAPRLSARVQRKGGKFTLRYTLSGGTKLGATITEQGKAGPNVIGTIKQGAGTLRFTPAGGPGGRRQLTAQFTRDGIPVGEAKAGSYTAPPPAKPRAAKKITIKRTKTGVTIRWTPGASADAQQVTVTTGDGLVRRFTLSRTTRSVKVTEVDKDDRVAAEVRGVTNAGRTGPKAKATLKAPKAKP